MEKKVVVLLGKEKGEFYISGETLLQQSSSAKSPKCSKK